MPAPLQAEHPAPRRRSYRFSHKVPVVLSSADPAPEFHERCETTEVSSHGCRIRCLRKLAPGQKVRLELADPKQQTDARVACVRPDVNATAWEIGLELAEPGNIWGLKFSPHMFHWPADLPLPPVRPEPAGARALETPPLPGPAEPRDEELRRLRPGGDLPAQPDELRRLQEQQSRAFEARINQTLREANDQLTKNAQFALNTVEASVRDLSDAGRRDLEEWFARHRAELDQQLARLSDTTRKAAVEVALQDLRQLLRQALAQELDGFRARLREAMEAGLRALAHNLEKGKRS